MLQLASPNHSNSASLSPSSHSNGHQTESESQQPQNQTFQLLASSKRVEVESLASPDLSLTAVEEPSSSTSSSHGGSQRTRSRRVFNFTASAFGVQRIKRLAINNQRLLRKHGITSIQIQDICNGEAIQRFDIPKRCPPSPPLTRPVKHKPPPKATQFALISPSLLRGSSTSSLPPSNPSAVNRSAKLATTSVQSKSSSNSLSMEQRTAVPQQLSRIPSQQMEPGSSVSNESPLLTNLLSNNNNQQAIQPGNGMPMNPGMMRHNPQQQQLQSPMYPAAQQSPQYMQASGMQHPHQMQGHPMMMAQPMPPQQLAQQTMPPPVAQAPEQPATKKRKRQTKKQKEEESKKQQQQQQASSQMHPGMIQPGMHPDPQFYMLQQDGQQRVPPMHMANSQQMSQYRPMPYGSYSQHPSHYGQPSTSMMTPQYPGQHQYSQQQMWNPNMPSQHQMAQQSDYHMQMRNQMQQQTSMQHYSAPQQSPVTENMKGRIPPPPYNDSMQQQFIQQQRQNPSFMSPPPNQGPSSSYPGQMHQSQAAAQHYAQLQHQRVMSDIMNDNNVDDLMATIGGDGAEDYDLDSIELEPMRAEGTEMSGMQQTQNVPPTPQQAQQHPGPNPHYYQQPSMPGVYGGSVVSYGSPSSQQFVQQNQQNFQMHPNMMPPHQQIQQQQRDQAVQKEKNREQQEKTEQKQLEYAMSKSPHDPHSPSNVEIPLKQRQQVITAIDSVMERVMSGRPFDDSGASTSNQPTPPPNKRKKPAAKNAAAQQQSAANASRGQQAQVQTMPSQQQAPGGQFVAHMQTMAMYGNGQQNPNAPNQFNNSQHQPYYYQHRIQQMHMRPMSYSGQQPQGPSTPLSAPPTSTPDQQQYFYNQQQGLPPPQSAPNGALPASSRATSFKNIMPRSETSNPETPQTPNQQPTPQQMSQKMFGQENGGGSSATSSAAATPSSSSQHRMSIDEQTGFSQQQQYSQYNGHANPNPHFVFNQQSVENEVLNEMKLQNTGVSLKGELNTPANDHCNTPPSANAGISSATPTTANQLNHHHPADTEPKNEPQQAVDMVPVKLELSNVHGKLNEDVFGGDIAQKTELNGPVSAAQTATTSTIAE